MRVRFVIATIGVLSILRMFNVLTVHAHGGDPTKIHGCVDSRGSIRIVGSNDTCSKNETALDWNISGPQGPQGTQGPQGVTGPQGPQGPAGIANVGSIVGEVTNACGGPVDGTLVYLEGRSFSVKTGTPATFALEHVPADSYRLIVEVPSQTSLDMPVQVVAGQITNLGQLSATDFESDPNNCGACGQVCPSGICTGGQCQAPAGGLCGNGVVDPGEACDNSTCANGQGICSATCACIQCPTFECLLTVVGTNACAYQSLPAGTPCTGGVCDGVGSCVP